MYRLYHMRIFLFYMNDVDILQFPEHRQNYRHAPVLDVSNHFSMPRTGLQSGVGPLWIRMEIFRIELGAVRVYWTVAKMDRTSFCSILQNSEM